MEQEQSKIQIKIRPNAGRKEITGFKNGVLLVKVTAPPIKGKANEELIDLLAGALGVCKGNIDIVRGVSSRNKLVAIIGLTTEEIKQRLGENDD